MALLIGSCSIFLVAIVLKPIAGEFGRLRFIPSLAFSLQFSLGKPSPEPFARPSPGK
ncbi:MAG: hypothetical protein VXZ99_17630 [Pseudomonadota bacterium]|nr:hypothetical protein [Pseudomonadota bacterium]